MESALQRKLTLKFTPALRKWLPKDVRQKKGRLFTSAVSKKMQELMKHLGGLVEVLSAEGDTVEITWQPPADKSSVASIVALLKAGQHNDAILLMELLLSDDPLHIDHLYNLGMVYSDQGEFDRSIALLTKLLEQDPQHTNGRVALGVALVRKGQIADGVEVLQNAVAQEPANPWAHRNLGAGLAKLGRNDEALDHLRRAAQLNPEDQAAWHGLGQILETVDQDHEADEAYHKAIDLDEFSPIAEASRQALSKLAQKTFRSAMPAIERPDAVMYCVGALEKFETLPPSEVQKIGFEIAMLGTRGLDVNDSAQKYSLRSLPGQFSGLHLLCIEYVAFKQIAPEQDIGFDLSAEYRMALTLFGRKASESD